MRFAKTLSATSISALALLVSAPALAVEPAPAADVEAAEAGAGLETIVVTAQKRQENLQEIPIAISVLTSTALENRHVTSLVDLGDGAIPSLKVAPFFSRSSALVMNIRGIGVLADSNQPARDQGVGVYIDGVYLGRAQGLGTAMYDIENIEVLKGPQGTLFGRNTEGGAVNITTKKPSGEFKLGAMAGLGNFGSFKGELHLDLPEFAGISVKIDGIVAERGGLVDNPLAGQSDFNAYQKRGLHAAALWAPSTAFSAMYSFDTSYDASTPLYMNALAAGTFPRAAVGVIEPERVRVASVGVPQQPSIGKTHGHLLNLQYEAAQGITLKSITSYRELDQGQFDNANYSPNLSNRTGVFTGQNFARYSLAHFNQDQFSQELQVVGELPRLKFAAGAMYYRENVEDNAQAFDTMQFTDAKGSAFIMRSIDYAAQRIDRASRIRTTSVGVYGQGTYTPAIAGDIVHLTAGARWTRDKKEGSLFIVNGAAPSVNGVVGPRLLDASWSRVDPMVNLSVDAADDVHLYGKWSTGYKSGGANSRSLFYAPFNPESVSMFEIGAKTEFWNNRARLNVAAYTGSYKDIQLDFFANYDQIVNGVLLTTTRTTSETTNAPGKGRVKGVEVDLTLNPVEGLTLSGSYAYNSVKIPATVNPFPQTNGVFITTPVKIYPVYTPQHAASGAIDYEAPVGGATLRLHLDGNFDGGYYANYNDPSPALAQPKGDKAFIVNGRIALADIELGKGDAKFTVAAWARNLFNEQHVFYKTASIERGVSGFINDARTFGIEIGVKM